jgi:hypothetical protein
MELLASLAPTLIGALPGLIKGAVPIVGNIVKGISDAIDPNHEVAGFNTKNVMSGIGDTIRTINGPKRVVEMSERDIEAQNFYQSKKGLNERQAIKYGVDEDEDYVDEDEETVKLPVKKSKPRRMPRRVPRRQGRLKNYTR